MGVADGPDSPLRSPRYSAAAIRFRQVLFALRKQDVDLEERLLYVRRSHGSSRGMGHGNIAVTLVRASRKVSFGSTGWVAGSLTDLDTRAL